MADIIASSILPVAIMDFEQLDLDQQLISALDALQITKPTTIQKQMIPVAMEGEDVMASAPTGTGKTLAFLLPAYQHLIDFPRQSPGSARVLILTPTRELAEQVSEQSKHLAKYTLQASELVTGGINYGSHYDFLEHNLDVLVATPGRLLQYIDDEIFDCRDVEILIIDEADRMLDMGFIESMERISSEARWRKQTFLLSATLEGRGLKRFAESVLNDPQQVFAQPPKKETGKIHQWIHLADTYDHKLQLLSYYLNSEEVESAVVFVKTRERLDTLVGQLRNLDVVSCWLRGEMPQDKRNSAIQRFRDGEVKVLIATDVAARGLDIEHITHVFNFDLPRTADVYIHRIGRTARAGKKGTAISIVEAHEMGILGKIERYIKNPLKRRVVEGLKPKHKEAAIPKKKKVKGKKKVKKAKK